MGNEQNNKRIAKNTLMLYIRMMLTMLVYLYTSRVVLNTLGVEDFGIYNVVGGVVLMFEFLNGAMTSATQRFLSFELGRNNIVELKRVFSMSINIHILIALIILFLAETVGLWFVKTHLTIPEVRMNAAIWVYHFSVLSFIATILRVPYNATIIANERMQAYAFISIIDVTLKLIIVFVLLGADYDKLKLYAILTFAVILLISIVYQLYCKINFPDIKYKNNWDKALFTRMFSFAGWNLWSNMAYVGFTTGINILLNIFFGPSINAARSIAYQVNGAVYNFVSNFRVALNPQIIKSYASEDYKYMNNLVFISSKYSYFLLLTLALPVLIETEVILKWWLKTVPDYTALFCRLIILNSMIDCIAAPLITTAQATGKIKRYHFVTGSLYLSILPISYILLKFGYPPQTTNFVNIFVSIISLISQMFMISKLIAFSKTDFIKQVLAPVLSVSTLAIILPIIIYLSIDNKFYRFLSVFIDSICCTLVVIYLVGMSVNEKRFLNEKILIGYNKFLKY